MIVLIRREVESSIRSCIRQGGKSGIDTYYLKVSMWCGSLVAVRLSKLPLLTAHDVGLISG